mmetsp:Transcript_24657/g.62029  ORF Transcript_24657/g.62029 Transcript_24657/m.62029 type:complete len:330 (+) Transcript_24657:227-1216(+)
MSSVHLPRPRAGRRRGRPARRCVVARPAVLGSGTEHRRGGRGEGLRPALDRRAGSRPAASGAEVGLVPGQAHAAASVVGGWQRRLAPQVARAVEEAAPRGVIVVLAGGGVAVRGVIGDGDGGVRGGRRAAAFALAPVEGRVRRAEAAQRRVGQGLREGGRGPWRQHRVQHAAVVLGAAESHRRLVDRVCGAQILVARAGGAQMQEVASFALLGERQVDRRGVVRRGRLGVRGIRLRLLPTAEAVILRAQQRLPIAGLLQAALEVADLLAALLDAPLQLGQLLAGGRNRVLARRRAADARSRRLLGLLLLLLQEALCLGLRLAKCLPQLR